MTEWHPAERTVTNRRTGFAYSLVPADTLEPTEHQLQGIAAICNEPAVYGFLFSERLQGRPYAVSDAERFLEWASRGWADQTYFVFALLDSNRDVAAAVDIKSAHRAAAEIGYWCSERHRGLMSNAVSELKALAREAGFRSLFAIVDPANGASIKVLERNGFLVNRSWCEKPNRLRYDLADVQL